MQAERQADSRPVLAIDTCGKRPGVALVAGGVMHAAEPADAAARADHVVRLASELLAAAALDVADLACLAVTVGPGSYTGVRIGLALVRGLSLVDEIPVVALGSLELLALTAPAEDGRVCAALDASKESIYAAVYDRRGDAVREIVAPRLVTRAELGEFLLESGGTECFVRCESEGAIAIDASVRTLLVTPMRARRLAEVAQLRFASGLATRADAAMPLYVGASAARPNQNKVVVPRETSK